MKLLLVAMLSMLVSCTAPDKAEVAECESEILRQLATPGTYERVEANWFNNPLSRENIALLRKASFVKAGTPDEALGLIDVFINYDAENLYGAKVRGIKHCQWKVVGSLEPVRLPQTLSELQAEGLIADAEADVSAAIKAGE